MRQFSRLLPWLGVAMLVTSCGDSFAPITDLPRQLTVAEVDLIEADNRFAFKLFQEINEQEGDKNIFISPLSVAMALGMTYNGAAGTTQEAMEQALELQGMTLENVNQAYRGLIDLLRDLDPRVEFLLANSIWYRHTMTFEQDFLDRNQQFFDAEVTGLDFGDPSASQTINGWVNDHTNGKIQEIVPGQIPADIIMYLINAVYFKGDWTYQFDKSRTQDASFTLVNGAQTTVDMMSQNGEIEIGLTWQDGVFVADLPYGGEAYSMTILLPESAEEIHALVEELTQDNWDTWIAGLEPNEISVSMPKFTLEYEITLNEVLEALGMGIAFTGGADFTRMYGPGGIWIDEVKHKTFVDVDEEGTEAAAVTSVSMTLSAPSSFVVDRPFLFVIRERLSGSILFMGKMMDPTAG